MKKLIGFLLLLPVAAALLLALITGIAMQQNMLTKSDLEFLTDLGQREGIGAVVSVIKAELYGVDQSTISDPSYGREQIAGRGYAPWVIRGNLDGNPRMLKFALAPDLWAAYDTQKLSLYQVWQGQVLFEGAAYNYRHGPQPSSQGQWFIRDSEGAQWFVQAGGEELPATVEYLGHEYGEGRSTAAMRFALTAGDYRLELTEQPDVIEREGQRYLTRQFSRTDATPELTAGFHTGTGKRHVANGTLEFALTSPTPIKPHEGPNRGREALQGELQEGRSIIAGSDCLSCHGETHRIAGPAWSQIAGKFRNKLQMEVVNSLASKVIDGGAGTWGTIPMPAHPELSMEQARAAVTYILSVAETEGVLNPPLDANGQPYVATEAYDVLPRPDSLHPSFSLENLAPQGFEPKVGGMDFNSSGKLLLASWDADGAVFAIDPDAPPALRVKRIAEGLQEPLGLTIVDDRLFVLQKQELTELIDNDKDGITDFYRTVSYDWPSSANFHSFAFGLLHRDDAFYFLLSICVLPGGASCPDQLPTQGKLLRADMNGEVEIFASGFRTPNGIAEGPGGGIYVTDNQGDYLPASKVVRVERGDFYGSRAVPDEGVASAIEIPPAVWLPQDEVGNSPTEPLLLQEGPYKGQMIHGDVYNGGIKRVFIEEIAGRPQGAAFHFSAGFQGPVNRLHRGPDGAIYLGEIGNPPNWGEYGKPWHGLERMQWQGNKAFEMSAVRARPDGFELELTQPLAADTELSPADLLVKQWFYHPNEQYGGPKYNEMALTPSALEVSSDRRSIRARIPGLKAGHVVYLRLDERLRSVNDDKLWTAEAWYTLNAIPSGEPSVVTAAAPPQGDWRDLFDGQTLDGWRNYGGDENDVKKWQVKDDTLTLKQDGAFPAWDMISSVIFGGGSADLIYYREKFRNFELSLEWKISENGNSGIFYLVEDESENNPWRTGIEMQVLDNEGHSDGEIKTHRAGDLYDFISADPETVRPPGQWNEVRIRVKDNHIEHWMNGVKVVSVLRGSDEWNTLLANSKFADMPGFGASESGYIVLQDHGDPVWYRNIRVRDL